MTLMPSSRLNPKILLCFCAICIIWGSTFLAMRQAVVTIPPFVVTALRYLLASLLLASVGRWRCEPMLTRPSLILAAVSGFLLAFANALVGYSVTTLPTGLVAVVIGSLPAWIILLDWGLFHGRPPGWGQVVGILVSLTGVGALTHSSLQALSVTGWVVWVALFTSILSWSLGTLLQRQSRQRGPLFTFTAVQCAVGGLLIGLMTLSQGDLSFRWDQISGTGVAAVAYLVLAGTVGASTAYVWLSQNADARLVSTYALITPVVAVWLGWLFAGEAVTSATLVQSVLVVAGIGLIVTSHAPVPPAAAPPETGEAPHAAILDPQSSVTT